MSLRVCISMEDDQLSVRLADSHLINGACQVPLLTIETMSNAGVDFSCLDLNQSSLANDVDVPLHQHIPSGISSSPALCILSRIAFTYVSGNVASCFVPCTDPKDRGSGSGSIHLHDRARP